MILFAFHSFEEDAQQDENAAAAKKLRELGYEPHWTTKPPYVEWRKATITATEPHKDKVQ